MDGRTGGRTKALEEVLVDLKWKLVPNNKKCQKKLTLMGSEKTLDETTPTTLQNSLYLQKHSFDVYHPSWCQIRSPPKQYWLNTIESTFLIIFLLRKLHPAEQCLDQNFFFRQIMSHFRLNRKSLETTIETMWLSPSLYISASTFAPINNVLVLIEVGQKSNRQCTTKSAQRPQKPSTLIKPIKKWTDTY